MCRCGTIGQGVGTNLGLWEPSEAVWKPKPTVLAGVGTFGGRRKKSRRVEPSRVNGKTCPPVILWQGWSTLWRIIKGYMGFWHYHLSLNYRIHGEVSANIWYLIWICLMRCFCSGLEPMNIAPWLSPHSRMLLIVMPNSLWSELTHTR
jgi:hypothetical protein